MNSLLEPEGLIRIVVATTSLGMGVNIKDIEYVIHIGPLTDIEDYIQAIGRAGRDGRTSTAILYFTGHQLGKCSKAMKTYARCQDGCLREALYEQFDTKPKKPDELHHCCAFCKGKCKCDGNSCESPIPPFQGCSLTIDKVPFRDVTEEQRELVAELLTDFKRSLDKDSLSAKCFTGRHIMTGFSDGTVKEIVDNCEYISSVDYIVNNLPIIWRKDALEVMYVIKDVFNDVEIDKSDELSLHEKVIPFDDEIDKDLLYGDCYELDSDEDEFLFEKPVIWSVRH